MGDLKARGHLIIHARSAVSERRILSKGFQSDSVNANLMLGAWVYDNVAIFARAQLGDGDSG